jgi:hypothetical protein
VPRKLYCACIQHQLFALTWRLSTCMLKQIYSKSSLYIAIYLAGCTPAWGIYTLSIPWPVGTVTVRIYRLCNWSLLFRLNWQGKDGLAMHKTKLVKIGESGIGVNRFRLGQKLPIQIKSKSAPELVFNGSTLKSLSFVYCCSVGGLRRKTRLVSQFNICKG